MNREIAGDVVFFLAAVVLGMGAALVYDLLRVWRRFRKHTLFAVSVQDFIYWFLLGLAGFRLIYCYNDGILRFFAFLGIALGMGIYAVTVGRFFVKYCLKLLLLFTFPLRKGLIFLKKQGKLVLSKLGRSLGLQGHRGRMDALEKKRRKKKNRLQTASAGSSGDVRPDDVQ